MPFGAFLLVTQPLAQNKGPSLAEMHIFDHESAATCCPHGCAPFWSSALSALPHVPQLTTIEPLERYKEEPWKVGNLGPEHCLSRPWGSQNSDPDRHSSLLRSLWARVHHSLLHHCQLLSIQDFYRLRCQLEMGLGSSIYMMEIGKCPKSELSTNSQTTAAHSSTLQEALSTFKQAEDWGRLCGRRACMHKAIS